MGAISASVGPRVGPQAVGCLQSSWSAAEPACLWLPVLTKNESGKQARSYAWVLFLCATLTLDPGGWAEQVGAAAWRSHLPGDSLRPGKPQSPIWLQTLSLPARGPVPGPPLLLWEFQQPLLLADTQDF